MSGALQPKPDWAARIVESWRQSVLGILETGRLLIQAKEEMPHGKFEPMVENGLPFGMRTAQRLMALAANAILTKATHASHLPASWMTLYELSRLPDTTLRRALEDGTVSPETERSDVLKLLRGEAPEPEPWDLEEALDHLVAAVRRVSERWPTGDNSWDALGKQLTDLAERALTSKLALHRMSFSGLGAMAGGPLGGADQSRATYKVDCRWNPEGIRKAIAVLHKRLAQFDELRITNLDFRRLLYDAPERCFIYLDPPYYEKGSQLYKHAMSPDDHRSLASLLHTTRAHWTLSYDDHAEIRRLYSWADFREMHLKYTTARARGSERPKNHEVLICPRRTEARRAVA